MTDREAVRLAGFAFLAGVGLTIAPFIWRYVRFIR